MIAIAMFSYQENSFHHQDTALSPFIEFQPFLQLQEYTQERAELLADLFLTSIILACWLAAFLMLRIGRSQGYPRLATLGAVALGVMTIATPLVPYVSGTIVFDFALIALFGFLGGIVAAVGYTRLHPGRPPPATK